MLRIRLRTLLITAFLLLGVVLAIGYSMLTADFLVRGMDLVLSRDMELTLQHLEQRGQLSSGQYEGYFITDQWTKAPAEYQSAFGNIPEEPGVLYKARAVAEDGGSYPHRLHFVMPYEVQQQGKRSTWFILTTLQRPQEPSVVDEQFYQSRRDIWMIGIAALLLVFSIAVLLYRMISRPAQKLLDWTHTLDQQGLQQPLPDFGYTELNELARIMHSGLARVQQSLQREKSFLSFASHELRTPIAVIRNNTELLSRLADKGMALTDSRVESTLHRLERAGITMSQLTETLLWLSRDDIEALPASAVTPGELTRQLTEELAFLLDNKQVVLELHLDDDWSARLPLTPLRIVLGNLIRNAFQHTWEGRVVISQQQGLIQINNHESYISQATAEALEQGNQGFGLGLILTADLTRRLGWDYRNESCADGHRVSLQLREYQPPAAPV
ncbi:sensor histidine kinase [Oceanobacter mangrovi]|uniref:sensor histidine kinase n=1 Tax=Oceanobacter mangrovi TaxID=2862510 RepID=UPI001C8E0478|nr:HAMP domain-containing sensor histidine kinase [Oceanobacter mangrovi]